MTRTPAELERVGGGEVVATDGGGWIKRIRIRRYVPLKATP